MVNNDIHLDDQYRKAIKVEPYDGNGARGGGNHPMSGEPLFKCPRYGLTARSYCFSCSSFNGLKKDKQGNLGECDLYPGARSAVVGQVARIQPKEITNKISPETMKKMGVRNMNDNLSFTTRSFATESIGKKSWEQELRSRDLNEVHKDFRKRKF